MLDHGVIPLAAVVAFAVVLLAWTVFALRRRWTTMLAAAPAFPAGRFTG
jgi:isoprenylcysteine carboxyl methyltransferase (ICMT) family protein YpbQ